MSISVSENKWASTRFGAWVEEYRVSQLAFMLRSKGHSVTAQAIYQWLRGETQPRPPIARDIAELSGLSTDEVYSHQQAIKQLGTQEQAQ